MASSINGPCVQQCSICLNLVLDDKSRGKAGLICGHVFHLDCIGSEFNYKGEMKCPNCRVIEQGKWLLPDEEFNVHRLANIATQLPMSAIDNWTNMHRNGQHTWNNAQAEQRAQGMEEQIRLLTHHVIQLRDVITGLAPDISLPPMPPHPAPPSELSPTHDDDDDDDDVIFLGD